MEIMINENNNYYDNYSMLPPPLPNEINKLNKNDIISIKSGKTIISLPRKIKIDKNSIRDYHSNGYIFTAYNKEKNQRLLVKKISYLFFKNHVIARRCIRNLLFQNHFKGHPNIISNKGVFKTTSINFNKNINFPLQRKSDDDIYIISDNSFTTLYQLIRSSNKINNDTINGLSESISKYLLYQILKALKFIHSADVIHRSLDPKTILVDENYNLKIADLGYCFSKDSPIDLFLKDYHTSWSYRSPETIVMMSDYTYAIDIWTIGCIFAEMLLGKTLFRGTTNHLEQIIAITKLIGTPNTDECYLSQNKMARDFILNIPMEPKGVGIKKKFNFSSKYAIELLEGMLCFDPNKRMKIDDILKHPYFQDIHSEDDDEVLKLTSNKFKLKSHFELFKLNSSQLKGMLEREFQTSINNL